MDIWGGGGGGGYFSYSRKKLFSHSSVNYNDVHLEDNSKLNAVINFQFLFSERRIDQSITP